MCLCFSRFLIYLSIYLWETGASLASGHVRHVAIFSMLTKISGSETYLEITCDEFVLYTMAALLKGTLILYQKTRFLA